MNYYTEADFEHIVDLPTFQDKSLLIKYVYPSMDSRTTAIMAPRRFGKTTNIRMIRHFFEADIDESGQKRMWDAHKHYKLFKDLKIFKQEEAFAKQHFGQYPVVWIDLSHYRIQADYKAALRMLTLEMYEQHSYLEKSQSLPSIERQGFVRTFKRLNDTFSGNEGGQLIEWLQEHHGQKVILLFDEFDSPSLDAMFSSTQYGDKALTELFHYLRPQVKNNPPVLFTLFTGTTRILSTEINTVIYESVFDNEEIASFYGYSTEDIQTAAKKMGRGEMVDQMRSYYNAYKVRGSDQTIFNTLSISACLTTGVVKSFWEAGKGLDNIKALLDYNLLGKLVEDSLFAPTRIELQGIITKYDLKRLKGIVDNKSVDAGPRNVFFHYLLEQGYYAYVKKTPLLGNHVNIEVPNGETRVALQRYLYTQTFFREKYRVEVDVINNFATCLKCLEPTQESVEKLKKAITAVFEKQLPQNEEELRANLYYIAYAFALDVFDIVRAEKYVKMSKGKLEGTGRSYTDILVSKKLDEQKNNRDARVFTIIECKCDDKERAEDALRQIVDYEYDTSTDVQKKDSLGKPTLIQHVGVSHHKTHGWEVCVEFRSTETDCPKTIRTK